MSTRYAVALAWLAVLLGGLSACAGDVRSCASIVDADEMPAYGTPCKGDYGYKITWGEYYTELIKTGDGL